MNSRIENFPCIKSVGIFVLHGVCKFQNNQIIIYRVHHNYGNTHFMIVLDEKQSNLKLCWIY